MGWVVGVRSGMRGLIVIGPTFQGRLVSWSYGVKGLRWGSCAFSCIFVH